VKTQWLNRKLQANVSAFHIDYSNQQVSTTLLLPPYRTPVTVPKTQINGAEFEAAYLLFDGFTISGTLAWLDARFGATSASATEGTQSPKSPHWSGSTSVQYMRPLNGAWTLNAHADVAFHSRQYLYLQNTQLVPSNVFVNARIGVETDRYGVYVVGRNLTDTIEDQTNAGVNAVYAARYRNEPRSYGIELRVKL
jgi:iron complex outermembrane recepter protein